MEPLEPWLARQYRHAALAMQAAIGPLAVVKARPGFGQTITAARGAVVASPVPASYDPDPDYFFHWYRDSAVVIDALRLLFEDGGSAPAALAQFADFVHFSLSLQNLDGRELVAQPGWRERVAPDFVKFLRSDADLAAAHGERVSAETRVNPDGTLDISIWPRPQNDGPALRALTLMRWSRSAPLDAGLRAAVAKLLRRDLAYTQRHWREHCFDVWEEEKGLHYYTLRLAAAALRQGAGWLRGHGSDAEAQDAAAQASLIMHTLDDYWLPYQGHYCSRVLESGQRSAKELDIAVILSVLHADGSDSDDQGDSIDRGAHSVHDLRMHSTLARLEALFEAAYAINRDRPPMHGVALGRYAGDVYYSGGAYYFSTLAAAEFCFRAAAGADANTAPALRARGDAFLQTVRRFTPPGGELSEQFDQNSGRQSSARELAWSYAAFISCIAARRAVLG
jgi:glucoamylase